MNPHTFPHLTEEEFTEVLIDGDSAAECHAHLDVCTQCRGQIALFENAVSDFSRTSLLFAESRPAPRLQPKPQPRAIATPLGWAVAAVACLLVAVPVWNRNHAADLSTASVEVATEDTDAQISQDNRLLESVNLALSANEPSPLREYNLSPVDTTRRASGNP